MALVAYENQVKRLLQNPAAPTSLYSTADIDTYINAARFHVAAEGECVRFLGTLTTTIGQASYNFSAINTGTPSINGIAGVINVRSMLYGVGSGQRWVTPRSWEWFQLFKLNNPVPQSGFPVDWSQYGQGSAAVSGTPAMITSSLGGSLYIDPPPDLVYTLTLDCVCVPITLTNDVQIEVIPYLWTDAVPFFAAYYALLSAQTQARRADAEAYFNYYQTFMERARRLSNPSVTRHIYEQAADPTMANKIGTKGAA